MFLQRIIVVLSIIVGVWGNDANRNCSSLVVPREDILSGAPFILSFATGQINSQGQLELKFNQPVELEWIEVPTRGRTPLLMSAIRADGVNLGDLTILPGLRMSFPNFADILSLQFRQRQDPFPRPSLNEDILGMEIRYCLRGEVKGVRDEVKPEEPHRALKSGSSNEFDVVVVETGLYAEVSDTEGRNSYCFSSCMQASGQMGYCRSYCQNAGK